MTSTFLLIAALLVPPRAASPDALAALFLERFATASPAAFDSVDPDPESRKVFHDAVKQGSSRRAGFGRVVWRGGGRAVLLLTGTVQAKSGGDETNLVRHFSGFYEATESQGLWTLARQLPIDSLNFISGQALHVRLTPAVGLEVVDTLTVTVGTPYGFAVRLNNDVRLRDVRIDGRRAVFAFGGGVLWIESAPSPRRRVVLDYRLDLRERSDSAFGAFHNSDVWHPLFGYNSANATGVMSVTVRVPAAFHVMTSLPQTESVANGERTVYGRSEYPSWLVSLIWDRDWRTVTTSIDGVRFETFTTAGFHFSHDSLARAFKGLVKLFGSRFGPAQPAYMAAVEDRVLKDGGFKVHMGNAVVSGAGGGELIRAGNGPGFVYAHEIAHGWTMNATGPAANMLREGWATFAELTALGAAYGPEVEGAGWEMRRNGYMVGSEGKLSILGSPDNGGVHYSKGSWIFHMLDETLGDSVFDAGIREYIGFQTAGKAAGYQELISSMSQVAGHDMTSFIMPWLAETVIPDVHARVMGRKIILVQAQATPPFDLPLDLAVTTVSGQTLRRAVHLTTRADTVDLGSADSAVAVRVDPDHRLLLRRHWGEVARFELPVAQAGSAKTVALVGDFAEKPVPATRSGNAWVVEVPLSDGRYLWSWQFDDKPLSADQQRDSSAVRVVQPLMLLNASSPPIVGTN